MSKIVILDNGHGGMIAGQYQTPGKRSPNWSKGVLYEGAFNRWISSLVTRELDLLKIPYFHISPEHTDVSLHERARRANNIYRNNRNTYVLSIHANAGGGTGLEGFTSKGETASDPIGQEFLCDLQEEFKEMRMRSDNFDGDLDKEADYYILRKTQCPAFLLECGFMDHKKDYELLFSKDFQERMARTLVKTILKLYK